MIRILVTGLCTLHWGRLQFGNIGNYYIVEPLFRELHRVFPEAELVTTFQMTQEFAENEKIKILPMEWYYAWRENEIELAEKEYEAVLENKLEGFPYAEYVNTCQLIINVSGDMWGDNAEHVGHGRFLVDLYKMSIAQQLGKKTVLFGVTPGPFSEEETQIFAKQIFERFDLVINREPTSSYNMKKWGFSMDKVKDFACPAFLYQPQPVIQRNDEFQRLLQKIKGDTPIIGFTIGGFNMPIGPYDMWPRQENQYTVFVEAIEYIINVCKARLVLISHTNGFRLPPDFELIPGRDYPILKQLYEIVQQRGKLDNKEALIFIEEPYLPEITKLLIGQFDMMVTGRVHAFVAAVSQNVPTVCINYEKSFIPSTKMYGFAKLTGKEEFVVDPRNKKELLNKIWECYKNREEIRKELKNRVPNVKDLARSAFDEMRGLL
ncbi:MAG: polysaccharide pyruvyl transferase family protein [Acetivibrio ethanolgignens]